jgi:hypothetical protein
MSYKTLEVELENGRVHPSGAEPLPDHAHALLTILTLGSPAAVAPADSPLVERPSVALTCAELADRWESLSKLPPEEAAAFADDLEKARVNIPPLRSSWD